MITVFGTKTVSYKQSTVQPVQISFSTALNNSEYFCMIYTSIRNFLKNSFQIQTGNECLVGSRGIYMYTSI